MIEAIYKAFLGSTGICTDTRKIEKGNLFFALKGPNFNGNRYADQALQQGASYAIVDEKEFANGENYFLVEDVLSCLQELSAHHRKELNTPIIAITGSNGKTTTKELLYAVLSQQFSTYATEGNLNNHIGVPISLLSIEKEHELAIIEMGANHIGEIASYCVWAQPNFGLITNIGSAHLEGFGSHEGIVEGKTELYAAIAAANGSIFFNADSDILREKSRMVENSMSYSFGEDADYKMALVQESPSIELRYKNQLVRSALFGKYNATNIIAAIAIGCYMEVPMDAIIRGIGGYVPENNRSQLLEVGGCTYIMDAYNANPTSMEAALESLDALNADCKVAILGDMFELGEFEEEEHNSIVELALGKGFDAVVFVGPRFHKSNNSNAHFFVTTEEAKNWLLTQNFSNATLLLKGSRSMKLETLLNK